MLLDNIPKDLVLILPRPFFLLFLCVCVWVYVCEREWCVFSPFPSFLCACKHIEAHWLYSFLCAPLEDLESSIRCHDNSVLTFVCEC